MQRMKSFHTRLREAQDQVIRGKKHDQNKDVEAILRKPNMVCTDPQPVSLDSSNVDNTCNLPSAILILHFFCTAAETLLKVAFNRSYGPLLPDDSDDEKSPNKAAVKDAVKKMHEGSERFKKAGKSM